jgi:hypothetical protein
VRGIVALWLGFCLVILLGHFAITIEDPDSPIVIHRGAKHSKWLFLLPAWLQKGMNATVFVAVGRLIID